jgi:hypothetical protein
MLMCIFEPMVQRINHLYVQVVAVENRFSLTAPVIG